ncbi:DinB family protein [Acidithiobacillus ferrivorans SS3]|uniref:DinB family protein n=1 Tax=Acidithiobacillus ferrivorans SS3 TaxID=743299 RepID=G0JSP7_9PROT|nr:DinB family protein [Acidithiobacillus ferrivorans]AEM46604.1 DinB family protein [Acidithiobacillus ferrivorans SS3]MBU2766054.1 damage-inducible protein DinB [Acidithiobacillus ferrivorans]MBU2851082.1 damage-inducible protein DinB [Acidithiobacillus ferrivorans]
MTFRNHFITMSRHHQWATRKLLGNIKKIPGANYRKNFGSFFRSINGTLNHLLVADSIWISRFKNEPSPQITLDVEIETEFKSLIKRLKQSSSGWEEFVMRTADGKLSDEIATYCKALNGKDTSSPFASTLDHAFNHGTHHRGQITVAIATMGYLDTEVDQIYIIRNTPKNSLRQNNINCPQACVALQTAWDSIKHG